MTKESKLITMKSGSTIRFDTLQSGDFVITTTPHKRKHNQPKAGQIAIKKETALILCGQLLYELELDYSDDPGQEILEKINDLVVWPDKE